MTDFSEFYNELTGLIKKYEQKNTQLKIEEDLDSDFVKIFGEKISSLSKAQSGLDDVLELSYATAEHHPYWNLLFSSAQICQTILERWKDDLSSEDIDEINWNIRELQTSIKKIQQKLENT